MPSIGAGRILVVDDDDDAAEMLQDLLRTRGYEVEREACIAQINELLKHANYDIIISDIRLGSWSGLQLPALVGAAGSGRPLLIALSGDYGSLAEERSLAAGFDYHFSKPVELEELEASLIAGREVTEPVPSTVRRRSDSM